jgi:alpha,alpha-trehalase
MQQQTPIDIFQQLFIDLAMSGILADGKALSDAIPKVPVKEILEQYNRSKTQNNFDLKAFFAQYFQLPGENIDSFASDVSLPLGDHIRNLWAQLSRMPDSKVEGSSLIPLPYPYVVPGGRFNEVYYWDSYFTMLGLQISGKVGMIESIIDNFSYQIQTIGHIPNGNRTYYLSRSQPPFFCMMVELLAEINGQEVYLKYREVMESEYLYWTIGQKAVTVDGRHYVRYYDELDIPRLEMYKDDVELVEITSRPLGDMYRHLRSAAESGWDFSSRWCSNPMDLGTIETCNIIPVDLNSLISRMELILSKAFYNHGEKAKKYLNKYEYRKISIQTLFWNDSIGYYFDYHLLKQKQLENIHAGGIYPIALELSEITSASRALKFLKENLLKSGGISTTVINSGQQWDAPNGWAPLQWLAFKGALIYSDHKLAIEIAEKWTSMNERVYQKTGKMMEKYNVFDISLESGGGEYPVQDGFGWSNGVYLALIAELEKYKEMPKL